MNIYLLCNSNIVNFVLKTNGGGEWFLVGAEDLILLFFFFGVGDMLVGLGRKFYLGQDEIACFCLFRDVGVSLRFPCVPPGLKIFSLDLCRTVEKCRKCALEVGCMGDLSFILFYLFFL